MYLFYLKDVINSLIHFSKNTIFNLNKIHKQIL
jgi:hypothetical protein